MPDGPPPDPITDAEPPEPETESEEAEIERAAKVTAGDLDDAVRSWDRHCPPEYRGLLDAE